MDTEHQEPPRPPIRSHTTLRVLFVATAVVALVAMVWRTAPYRLVTNLFIIPWAACFVCGLFGLSLWAGFAIGFVAAIASDTYLISTIPKDGTAIDVALKYAIEDIFPATWIVGLSWLTASWWGLYLRYAWSNSDWPPAVEEDSRVSTTFQRRGLQERVIIRCASWPGGFLVISLLANVWAFMVGYWVFVEEYWVLMVGYLLFIVGYAALRRI